MGRKEKAGMTGVIYLTLLMLLLASCEQKNTEVQPVLSPVSNISVFNEMILDGLRISVGLLPDGDALIAETNGRIRLVRNIYRLPVIEPEPLALINTCNTEILLGIAIHPDFIRTRQFYVCIAEMYPDTWHQRIELWQLSPTRTSAVKNTVLHREAKGRKGEEAKKRRGEEALLQSSNLLIF